MGYRKMFKKETIFNPLPQSDAFWSLDAEKIIKWGLDNDQSKLERVYKNPLGRDWQSEVEVEPRIKKLHLSIVRRCIKKSWYIGINTELET